MAGSKERVVVVCHLRCNSWQPRFPTDSSGFFFFCKRPYTHPTEYWQQIDFIHETRHLCTPIRIDEIKAMSRGFTGGKQVKIICKCKILRSSMFILDNRK